MDYSLVQAALDTLLRWHLGCEEPDTDTSDEMALRIEDLVRMMAMNDVRIAEMHDEFNRTLEEEHDG